MLIYVLRCIENKKIPTKQAEKIQRIYINKTKVARRRFNLLPLKNKQTCFVEAGVG